MMQSGKLVLDFVVVFRVATFKLEGKGIRGIKGRLVICAKSGRQPARARFVFTINVPPSCFYAS